MLIMIIPAAFMFGFAGSGVMYARKSRITLEDFISARKSVGSIGSMATVVASVLGAWILVSPAEAATRAGLAAVVCYAIGQAAPILAFTAVGTKLRRLMPNGHSLNEFVWYRYGKLMYATTLIIVVLYMFTFIAAELGAISRALEFVTGVPLLFTMVLVVFSTLVYTVYGGLKVSIFTDKIQLIVIIPLLLILFLFTLNQLGGWQASLSNISSDSNLLSLTNQVGIEFGITLIIAILAANLFHQGFWQRIYAAKSDADIYKGFIVGGIIVIPMIIISGFFGLWAVSEGLVTDHYSASISLFLLADTILPETMLIVLSILALMLVMSSVDSLLNGIASIFTSDLPKVFSTIDPPDLIKYTRIITVILVIPAMFVGWAFQSVLYLFLIADLVCAAAMVPVFTGLYSKKITGINCFISFLVGLVSGGLFFPKSDLSGWWELESLTNVWHVLASGNLLASFTIAIVTSVVALGLLTMFTPSNEFDFDSLKEVEEITL